MKCMVMVRATAESEAGKMPDQELLAAMGAYIRTPLPPSTLHVT